MVKKALKIIFTRQGLAWLSLLLGAACLSACSLLGPGDPTPQAIALVTPTPVPSATPTLVEPTPLPSPTPEPLAAVVNGEGITLAEFQAELARFQAARLALPGMPAAPGTNLATDADVQSFVLDELINQRLLAQAATASGFTITQEALQARLDALTTQVGGAQGLQDWLTANQYDEASFRSALARSIANAWMRDQIITALPETADQVHARQILLYNLDQANQVLAQLRSGQDFAVLASTYDPTAGGDMGWFPQGYLTESKLEQAAFQLATGTYSDIIETRLGFHILQVIDRNSERLLDPDARLALQEKALQDWLQAQRTQSTIQITLP